MDAILKHQMNGCILSFLQKIQKVYESYESIQISYLFCYQHQNVFPERLKIAELNAYHEKFNTLPMSEEKIIISAFRSARSCDSFVKEFLTIQEQIAKEVSSLIKQRLVSFLQN